MNKKKAIESHFDADYSGFFSRYVNLPNGARDNAKVLCRFHDDTDPSLSLTLRGEKAGLWKCFGCDKSGNIYDFYALKNGLDTETQFPQVLDGIISEFGISVPQNGTPRKARTKTPEQRIETAHEALWNSPLLEDLKGRRGLADETIRKFKPGVERGKLVIPIYDRSGRIESVKIHHGSQTKGSHAQLYPWDSLESSELWICEGEPDVWRVTQEGVVAITGTAGAGTWKAEWSKLFRDKDVIIVYDADGDGREGRKIVVEALRGKAQRIRYVDWPESTPDKYDITNWLQDGHALSELPLVEIKDESVTLKDVLKAFDRWLYFEEGEIVVVEIVLAVVVANRYGGDPVWLFIVAPPGGCKTEILRALVDAIEVYMLSSLTPGALISGLKVKDGIEDPSLLPKLNSKVLVVKDFTTVLDMRRESRQEVMGQLRDAYDGEAARAFGSGVGRRAYKSKFGPGITPAPSLRFKRRYRYEGINSQEG